MTRSRLPVAIAALLLAAAPAFAELKVGIANPIKILNALQETKDINTTMENEQATFKTEAQNRENKLKDLQAQRDQLKPDAPQWAEKNKELLTQKNEATVWAQSTQQDMQRRFREQAKRMQEKIGGAIKKISEAKKIDLVLADQKPEISDAQMESMNPQQIMGVLFSRNILFSNDALDLTQEVIAELDKTYKK